MRVLVFSNRKEPGAAATLRRHGHTPVTRDPDVILAVGGDGTLLLAEHRHPGVPKLHVGMSPTSRKAAVRSVAEAARILHDGFTLHDEPKLQATIARGKRRIALPPALNDVIVRNRTQSHALRFRVRAGRRSWTGLIGDGIVVATPFGSTGYYESITRTRFARGIGLAWNNTTAPHAPVVLAPGAAVTLTVDRGEALVSVDTLDRTWPLRKGDTIVVRRARECARIIR